MRWTALGDGTVYDVYQGSSLSDFRLLGHTKETKFLAGRLRPKAKYFFRVQVGNVCRSSPSEPVSVVMPERPEVP